jgi:hypothetical protein
MLRFGKYFRSEQYGEEMAIFVRISTKCEEKKIVTPVLKKIANFFRISRTGGED